MKYFSYFPRKPILTFHPVGLQMERLFCVFAGHKFVGNAAPPLKISYVFFFLHSHHAHSVTNYWLLNNDQLFSSRMLS